MNIEMQSSGHRATFKVDWYAISELKDDIQNVFLDQQSILILQ